MAKKKESMSVEDRLAAALVPEEEWPYEIPENWCWVYSPMVFDIEYGKGLSTKQLTDTGYPVFGANGQIGFYSEYMFINPQALMSCRGAYSGKMCISLPMSFVTSNSLVIRGKSSQIDFKFIRYLFESQDTSNLVTGSAQPQVTIQTFDSFPIPLIPFPEQHRIVNQIESSFAKLDEIAEEAQAVIDGYENRKAAILHRAFTGELTEEWRRVSGNGIDTWKQCKLIDVLADKPRNGYSPKPVAYVTPYKSMTLSATTSGVFDPTHYKYIDELIPDDSYLWLVPGDILIQRANSLDKVGTSAVYTGKEHEFIYPDLLMKLQVNDSALSSYIAYALKDSRVIQYYRTKATGTAGNMPKINQGVVSNTPVAIPPLPEQYEIVRRLDTLLAAEAATKVAAEATLENITTLRQSILARAFRGELGTNDPDDEPAIELLKRTLLAN